VAVDERAYLASPQAGADLDWWREHLAGAPAASELATDHPRPSMPGYRGARHRSVMAAPLRTALFELARATRVTPYPVLLASFYWTLARYTGDHDLVVGAPAAGRTGADSHGVVGLLVNALPLRARVRDGQPFRTFVGDVATTVRSGLTAQRMPFPRVVQALAPSREAGRSPLFQVMLALQQAPGTDGAAGFAAGLGEARIGNLTMRARTVDTATAEFDLTLDAVDQDGRLVCDARFNPELWEESTIAALMRNWQALLEQVLANPNLPVSGVTLPCVEDHFADAVAPTGAGSRVMVDTPGPAALVGLVDERGQLDANELARAVRELAARLAEHGVHRGDFVGVLAGRSAAFVIATLAITRCGAADLPLHPGDPTARLTAQILDARPSVLCVAGGAGTVPQLMAALGTGAAPVVDITGRGTRTVPAVPLEPHDAAYVMYTSGTTGAPKGVCVQYRGLTNLLDDFAARAPLPDGAVCSWWTEPTFDVSVYEISSAQRAKGRLLVVPDPVRLDAEGLAGWLEDCGVQGAYVPAFALGALADRAERAARAGHPLALRRILVGVEPIAHDLLRRIVRAVPGLRIVNGYGPTETTICSTLFDVAAGPVVDGAAPIGRAVRNGPVHLLDRYLSLVPTGASGEIYVGGLGVSLGYLGRPALTAERFLPDPFARGGRMYRTGDQARYDGAGELRFLGRGDGQVKLRGTRIELGEVEATLARLPGVQAAAAAVREIHGQPILIGYVVTAEAGPAAAELSALVRLQLPAPMAPGVIMAVATLPLTRNGKLDRAALPAPTRSDDLDPPRGELECAVADAWSAVLDGARIGRDDDFFALGGHSLLAERSALELGRRLDREVPVALVMAHPSVADLAGVLARQRDTSGPIAVLSRAGDDLAGLRQRVMALPDDVVTSLVGQDG
jgi:amino acid adenylation domain-containing protein